MNWNDSIRGIHIIQVFALNYDLTIGDQIKQIIEGKPNPAQCPYCNRSFMHNTPLENPVVIIATLKSNASAKYGHAVKGTKQQSANKAIFINKSMQKYPHTEKILLEGGKDITLYSSRKFEKNKPTVV